MFAGLSALPLTPFTDGHLDEQTFAISSPASLQLVSTRSARSARPVATPTSAGKKATLPAALPARPRAACPS